MHFKSHGVTVSIDGLLLSRKDENFGLLESKSRRKEKRREVWIIMQKFHLKRSLPLVFMTRQRKTTNLWMQISESYVSKTWMEN